MVYPKKSDVIFKGEDLFVKYDKWTKRSHDNLVEQTNTSRKYGEHKGK